MSFEPQSVSRISVLGLLLTAIGLGLTLLHAEAQEKRPATGWVHPRTPDGQPDLQGTWTSATLTPLERPARFAGRAVMTEQEAAELEADSLKRFLEQTADRPAATSPPRRGGAVGSYNNAVWSDAAMKVASTRQTSLVVDPPDGRVPVRPEAERIRDERNKRSTDAYENMIVFDRCITRGVPGGFLPAPYNNGYQIIQSHGHVVILSEMIHEARIIALDRRTHRPPHLRSITGDSIGHWEGDTLVVDTTNYNDKGSIATGSTSGRIRGIPQSDALHVVERFRRIDPNTIMYTVTIDDPNVFTRPWTVSMPLVRDDTYRIFEYACHEGNYALRHMLQTARMMEQEAAAASPTR